MACKNTFSKQYDISIYQSPILGAHSADNELTVCTVMNRKIICEDMINYYMSWSIEIMAQVNNKM